MCGDSSAIGLRFPSRRQSPSHSSPYSGGNADGVTHEIPEFRHLKPTEDRYDSVVTTDFVKAEWKGYQPETRYSQPAAPQVGNDDPSPCHPVHLTDELYRVFMCEVMKHLRGDDKIERARRKGERQGVAGDSGDREFAGRANEFDSSVESEDIERDAMLSGKLPEPIRDVARAGTDVEKCRRSSGLAKQRRQLRLNGVDTAEESIGKSDVAMRSALQCRIAIVVEILDAPPS